MRRRPTSCLAAPHGAGPRGLCPGLSTGGASAATLRAYGRDLASSPTGPGARGREPGSLAYRDLRAYEPRSQSASWRRPASPASCAGSGFHTTWWPPRAAADNPADLLPTPKRGSYLPRVLGRDEVAALLDRIPARTPLECATAQCSSSPTRADCGRRRSCRWTSATSTSTRRPCASRAKGRRRASFRSVNRLSAMRRHLGRHHVRLLEERALFVAPRRRLLALDVRRRLLEWVRRRGGGPDLPTPCAHSSRPTCSRARIALDPGAARPFERLRPSPRVEPSRLRREYASHTRGRRSNADGGPQLHSDRV